jgi:hypothetical protein
VEETATFLAAMDESSDSSAPSPQKKRRKGASVQTTRTSGRKAKKEKPMGTAVAVVEAKTFWVMALAVDLLNQDKVSLWPLKPEDADSPDGTYEFANVEIVFEMPRASIYYEFDFLCVVLMRAS